MASPRVTRRLRVRRRIRLRNFAKGNFSPVRWSRAKAKERDGSSVGRRCRTFPTDACTPASRRSASTSLRPRAGAAWAAGIWTPQAGVFPENTASVILHERHGFRVVGRRDRLGKMTFGPLAGRWRDVLLLERRSTVAGKD